jgi:hypothetical protein
LFALAAIYLNYTKQCLRRRSSGKKGAINMKIDQKDLHKPGTDNLPPGVYKEVGPRGGKITGSKEVHIVEGHRLPPTNKAGNKWIKKD